MDRIKPLPLRRQALNTERLRTSLALSLETATLTSTAAAAAWRRPQPDKKTCDQWKLADPTVRWGTEMGNGKWERTLQW